MFCPHSGLNNANANAALFECDPVLLFLGTFVSLIFSLLWISLVFFCVVYFFTDLHGHASSILVDFSLIILEALVNCHQISVHFSQHFSQF